jgi:hypothetical protein
LHLDIEGPKASLRRLKRQTTDFGHADSVSPLHRHPTAENTGEHILEVRRSTDLVPPALVRAAQRKKASRGPPLILVTSLVAAIAYFMTESSAPPPHAVGEATAGLEATIGPPVPAVQNEMQPNDDSVIWPSGEASSSAAPPSVSTARLEERHSHIGAPKRAAGSAVASQAGSGAAPDSHKSTRAIHGNRQCAKRCTDPNCSASSGCSKEKTDSPRAQLLHKKPPQANTNPQTGIFH